MRSTWTIIGIIVLLVVGVIAVLSFSGRSDQPSGDKIRIVAAENFWGNITEQIGGDEVAVTSIISDPGTDPHLYESDARAAGAIAQADLVIKNGLGYDAFMDKLLEAAKNDNRKVMSAAETAGISGPEANPHIWYDPAKVIEVAKGIEAELTSKDPAHQELFKANLAKFISELQPVSDTIETIKRQYSGAPVAYTERVAEYLLLNAGLTVKTPGGFTKAIEEGNDPSPADTAAMEALINNRQIKVLLYNAQATSPVTQRVQDLATQAGIPVVGVTETIPNNEPTFQSWQLHQVQAILQALGKP